MLRHQSAISSVVVLLATLVLVACGPAAAETVDCPRVVFAPVLDSRLDDWPALPQFIVSDQSDWRPAESSFAEYGGPEDVSAEVRVAWDNQALYAAIEVRNDELVRVQSPAEIDRGDSIVLAIAGEDAEVVNQFVIALLRATSLVWRAEPADEAGEVRTIGHALAARPDEGGGSRLVYELSIPWSELKQVRPLPGTRFTLTVSVCDDDGEGLEGCLERAVNVTLSAKGVPPLVVSEAAPSTVALKPTFPAPSVVRFDEKCFTINGAHSLLLGGEIDYASLPENAWATRARLLRDAGFNLVAITIPWSHHQPTSDAPDLSGLVSFLHVCAESGLFVQAQVGPFAGHSWEAGGIPGWVVARERSEWEAAAEAWWDVLLPVIAEHQLSQGGPIASLIVHPIPDKKGEVGAGALASALAAVRGAQVVVPVLTDNVNVARAGHSQSLVNTLDTLSFYQPISASDLVPKLATLGREESGPIVLTALAGDYSSPAAARRSADTVRTALGQGATAVVLTDFAPGLNPSLMRGPASQIGAGMVDPAGALSTGYREARLLGQFLRLFGAGIARSTSVSGLVETDSPDVRADVRFSEKSAFLFLRNENLGESRQVRLRYLEPETEERVDIPQAGAIYLPPSGAKILPVGLPVGRGLLRYTTSEVAALHAMGERTLLVVYGDADTPGEIALGLPGPPLVSGPVARQSWDPDSKTLILDYYHGSEDRYLLVDELEIAILSRDRAAWATSIGGAGAAITLSGGVHLADAAVSTEALTATLACAPGAAEITAALPARPVSVTLDGQSVPFSYAPPERVLRFAVETKDLQEEQQPKSVWDKLGRSVLGGPPYSYAKFDRGFFRPDAEGRGGECATFSGPLGAPENLGLRTGAFARLSTRFGASDSAELLVADSNYPVFVFLNGQFLPEFSNYTSSRRMDVSTLLEPGYNDLDLVVQVLPRQPGLPGLRDLGARLLRVVLVSDGREVPLQEWQVCPGLAGEADGFYAEDADMRNWHFIRFGPWQEQGRELSDVNGVGWYRVTFDLPDVEAWSLPYYVHLELAGAGNVYLNEELLATVSGEGEYVVPIPSGTTRGGKNVFAAALYGFEPDVGLYSLEVAADSGQMRRQRKLEIRF
ncbi:MAG: beta-galactosidase [Armatimonadetes bacterium]|nr:beta-galactosidase [Armatimonadota bacterium]